MNGVVSPDASPESLRCRNRTRGRGGASAARVDRTLVRRERGDAADRPLARARGRELCRDQAAGTWMMVTASPGDHGTSQIRRSPCSAGRARRSPPRGTPRGGGLRSLPEGMAACARAGRDSRSRPASPRTRDRRAAAGDRAPRSAGSGRSRRARSAGSSRRGVRRARQCVHRCGSLLSPFSNRSGRRKPMDVGDVRERDDIPGDPQQRPAQSAPRPHRSASRARAPGSTRHAGTRKARARARAARRGCSRARGPRRREQGDHAAGCGARRARRCSARPTRETAMSSSPRRSGDRASRSSKKR